MYTAARGKLGRGCEPTRWRPAEVQSHGALSAAFTLRNHLRCHLLVCDEFSDPGTSLCDRLDQMGASLGPNGLATRQSSVG
jgi:hypothetical protein